MMPLSLCSLHWALVWIGGPGSVSPIYQTHSILLKENGTKRKVLRTRTHSSYCYHPLLLSSRLPSSITAAKVNYSDKIRNATDTMKLLSTFKVPLPTLHAAYLTAETFASFFIDKVDIIRITQPQVGSSLTINIPPSPPDMSATNSTWRSPILIVRNFLNLPLSQIAMCLNSLHADIQIHAH